jgi:hypothetical protein
LFLPINFSDICIPKTPFLRFKFGVSCFVLLFVPEYQKWVCSKASEPSSKLSFSSIFNASATLSFLLPFVVIAFIVCGCSQ